MNGEYIIDSYLDWYFKDEYEEEGEEYVEIYQRNNRTQTNDETKSA